MKDPRNDAPGSALQTRCICALLLEHGPEFLVQGKQPSFTVLGLTWVQAYDARIEINLVPLHRQDLARQSPASDVGERNDALELKRHMCPNGLELLPFEEAGAHVVLSQHWDVRLGENLRCPTTEGVGALEGRQFAIDGGVRRVFGLTSSDVPSDVSRRNGGRPEV